MKKKSSHNQAVAVDSEKCEEATVITLVFFLCSDHFILEV